MLNKGTMSMSNNPSSNLTFQNYEQAIAWQKGIELQYLKLAKHLQISNY